MTSSSLMIRREERTIFAEIISLFTNAIYLTHVIMLASTYPLQLYLNYFAKSVRRMPPMLHLLRANYLNVATV